MKKLTGIVLEECLSSQIELKNRLAADPQLPNLFYVQALKQTTGRGRQGREWSSPNGGLYLSFLIRGPHEHFTWAPHRIAIAVHQVLLPLIANASLKVKWPNDLVVNGNHKLAGILCEKIGQHIVVGLGLNILVAPQTDRAVSSLKEIATDPDSSLMAPPFSGLRDAILKMLDKPFQLSETRNHYEKISLFKPGQEVHWSDLQGHAGFPMQGTFLGYGEFGEMRVEELETKKRLSLFSEEVHLLQAK